jgi:signal transduction histidine kinase/ligand-binding sensor domain-containing protein
MRAVGVNTLILLVLVVVPATALEPHESPSRYGRMSWGEENGLMSGVIRALAQDPQGYLWLGTDAGLVRFDGTEFVSWPPNGTPDADQRLDVGIRALLVARDGSIWAGGMAGITHLKDGVRISYVSRDNVPARAISTFAEDDDGMVWAGGGGGAMTLVKGQWQRVDATTGLPDAAVNVIYKDPQGCIWISTSVGVYRRERTRHHFVRITESAISNLTVSVDGALWIASAKHGLRRVEPHPVTLRAFRGEPETRLLRDRDGNLWVGTVGRGLWRVREERGSKAVAEQLSGSDAVRTYGRVRALLEDHDGNLWVAADTRLLRLSDVDVKMINDSDGLPPGGIAAIAVTDDQTIWAGTDRGLYSIRWNSTGGTSVRREMRGSVTALHIDRLKQLWVATNRDVGRFEVGRYVSGDFVPLSLPTGTPSSPVAALAVNRDGGVWICDPIDGLKRWHDNRLERFGRLGSLQTARCNSIEVDETGTTWFGFNGGGAAAYVNGVLRAFDGSTGISELSGLEPTTVHAGFHKTLWLTTPGALIRFKDGRWETVARWSQLPGTTVSTVIEDATAHVWAGVYEGLLRVSTSSGEAPADLRLFDESNGLAGLVIAKPAGWPSAARSADGRLWFATSQGVASIDPAHFRPRGILGPAKVDSVVADKQSLPLGPTLQVPPGTAKLEIHYSALNLSAPKWVRFRYRLEGVDLDWVDAGSRRQAFYTNLSPGSYRFRVVASDREGSWPELESGLTVNLQPAFRQTLWFYVAIVCVGFSIVGTAWLLRLRVLRRRFSLILSERARVAREIHDTLLQSVGGVALELEVVADELDGASPASVAAVRDLRRRLTWCVREARDAIARLRSTVDDRDTLENSLKDLAASLASSRSCACSVKIIGAARSCSPTVSEQLLRIAQEAMTNALRHASPKEVVVELEYQYDSVRLCVTDDGSGFDTGNSGSALSRHWGIATMKERACSVGGSFNVTSVPGDGTRVEAVMPLEAVWNLG